jgi:hypothetical protein
MGGQARAGPAGHPLRVRRISTAKFLDGHPARQNMQIRSATTRPGLIMVESRTSVACDIRNSLPRPLAPQGAQQQAPVMRSKRTVLV